MRASWAVGAVLVAACGNPGGGLDPDASGSGSDGMTDGGGDGWTDLIKREWTIDPGIDGYRCRRIKVTEDTYVSGFRSLSPVGTHHELLTFSPDTQVGNFDCSGSAISTEPEMLYAGGEASNELLFPQGVAVKIPANSYILLYIHILNTSDAVLTQTSGIQVKTIPAADVVHEADMIFGGSMVFSIPADNAPHTVASDCGAPDDWHIVGVWPHMHQWGTHASILVKRAGVVTQTLVDADYSLANQHTYAMNITVPVNDRIETTCTFVNDTATTMPPGYSLQYGDSAGQEMCFSGMYKWPTTTDGLYACVKKQ